MARRRAALAAVALLLAMIPLGPGRPARAGLDSGASDACKATTGLPAQTNHPIDLVGDLRCYRPGGVTFQSPFRGPDLTPDQNAYQGEPCQNITYHRVGFVEADAGDMRASYDLTGGSVKDVPISSVDADNATLKDGYAAEVQTGSFQPGNPSDPTSPLTCTLDPTISRYCPTAAHPIGSACYVWFAHTITTATVFPPPPMSLLKWEGEIMGEISGATGKVHSMPTQTGVVNVPVCYWIEGMDIPDERDLVLNLQSLPDASGRRLTYTYLIRITFEKLRWVFDDPNDLANTEAPTDSACGDRIAHPQLTAHAYKEISDDHADGRYHVHAEEQYGVTAELYVVDSAHLAPRPIPIETSDLDIPTVRTPDYPQYVGQVEGVPVGG